MLLAALHDDAATALIGHILCAEHRATVAGFQRR
jgi:hypothetical protein